MTFGHWRWRPLTPMLLLAPDLWRFADEGI
jgi:hypothetical protein